jgi:hypothetical protein
MIVVKTNPEGGKSKVKKRFVVKSVVGLICTALMVSVLSFSGMTAGAEHPSHTHDWSFVSRYESPGYVSMNDSQHGILNRYV